MLVRATLRDLATSGAIVGRLSAVGTVGAITGTFLTGFVLLGLFPTRALILGVGALLVVVGLTLVIVLRRGGAGTTLLVLVAAGVGAIGAATPSPCDVESAFYCIDVRPDPANAAGRLLVLDGLHHAYVDLADPTRLEFGYVQRFADVASTQVRPTDGILDVLHIGGGGFTFPRYIQAIQPDARQTVLELDPRVLEVARTELGFGEEEPIEVVVGDARRSIERQPDDRYDLVVGDAFGGLAVPWHLTTSEFLDEVGRVLRPAGTYVMNLIDYPPLRFVRAEVATALARFGHVVVISGHATLSGDQGGNIVIAASDEPIDLAALRAALAASGDAGATGVIADAADVATFAAGSPVLRDDFAPVDQLLGR
jgi:SAM-dependent methyltransferase